MQGEAPATSSTCYSLQHSYLWQRAWRPANGASVDGSQHGSPTAVGANGRPGPTHTSNPPMMSSALRLWALICAAISCRYFPGSVLAQFKQTGQTPRSAKMPPLPSQTLRAARGDRPQGQQGPDPRAGAGSQNDSIFGRKLEEVFQLSNTLTSEEPPWPH